LFKRLKKQLKSLPQASLQASVEQIVSECRGSKPKPAVLGWEQLVRLHQEGVSLVPHTHTHPLLDQLSIEEARGEIVRSRDEILQRTGQSLSAFAYPSGHFSPQTITVLRDEGFDLAFTTVRGIIDLQTDDTLRLRRTNVARSTPDNLIRIQLAGASKITNRRMPQAFPEFHSALEKSENAAQGRPSTRWAPMPHTPVKNQTIGG
jgi:peptidoglycan/xylan/chitin deacetylase (PgdA/CDA1 family)